MANFVHALEKYNLFSCAIIFRALVVETPETWFADENGLSLIVCQNPKAEEDDQGPVLSECCACDEAKYEVAFEGLWSRNTHPKVYLSLINKKCNKYSLERLLLA